MSHPNKRVRQEPMLLKRFLLYINREDKHYKSYESSEKVNNISQYIKKR